MADLMVNQTPVSVNFDCDNCDEEVTIEYDEFINQYGEPYDWSYEKVKCPHCGHVNIIENWEFD